jgi:hypothetical protein
MRACKYHEKALLKAAEDGDTHTVASLIEAGTDPVCTDEVRVCACVVCVFVCVCVRARVAGIAGRWRDVYHT